MPHKGFKMTEETKKKLSLSKTGKKLGKHSPETIEKIRRSHIGLKHTEESKQKMRGRKVSDASRELMRKRKLGSKLSRETKRRISIAMGGTGSSSTKRLEMRDPTRPRTMMESTKVKISIALSGEKNYQWKGDNTSYRSLHRWVRKHLPRPNKCQICNFNDPLHVSNISGRYLRKLSDWQWICLSCHGLFDSIKRRRNNI